MAIKNIDKRLKEFRIPFNETEKNLVSFKENFQIQHTSDFKENLNDESFPKSQLVYNDDIIVNSDQIPFLPDNGLSHLIQPYKKKTWVKATNITYDITNPEMDTHQYNSKVVYDPMERLYRGYFSESINPNGNHNIEEIIMPLIKVGGTDNQFYIAFGKENMNHTEFYNLFNNLEGAQDQSSGNDYSYISGSAFIDGNFIKPGLEHFQTASHAGALSFYNDPTKGAESIRHTFYDDASNTTSAFNKLYIGRPGSDVENEYGSGPFEVGDKAMITHDLSTSAPFADWLSEFTTEGTHIFSGSYDDDTPSTDHLGNNIRGVFGLRRLKFYEGVPSEIFASSSFILNNFISNTKFGSAYKVEIYESTLGGKDAASFGTTPTDFGNSMFPDYNTNVKQSINYAFNGPNFTIGITQDSALDFHKTDNGYFPREISVEGRGAFSNNKDKTGGLIFDYKQGTLFVGVPTKSSPDAQPHQFYPSGSAPNISLKTHPLWMRAYRYVGPTGYSVPSASNSQYENLTISANVISASHIDTKTMNLNGFTVEEITSTNTTNLNSTSFGSNLTDTHNFTGSLIVSGAAKITGSLNVSESINTNNISSLIISSSEISSSIISSSKIIAEEYLNIDGTPAISSFPFFGSAQITGSLLISGSNPFIEISKSVSNPGNERLYNLGGNLFWGNTLIGNSTNESGLSADSNPTLNTNLNLNGKNINDVVGSSIINLQNPTNLSFIKFNNQQLDFSPLSFISQSHLSKLVTNEIGQTTFVGNISMSNGGKIQGTHEIKTIDPSINSQYPFIVHKDGILFTSSINQTTESVYIDDNITITGLITASIISASSITSSLFGTSSYSLLASHSISASFASSSTSASYSTTASFVVSSSYAATSSQALTASFAHTAFGTLGNVIGDLDGTASVAISSSYASSSTSASYALTSSHAVFANFALNNINDLWYEGGTYLSSSFPILISESLSIGSPHSSSTLTVSSSVLISNTKDTAINPTEGVLIHSYGDNNKTINEIDLNSFPNTGIKIINNGSDSDISEGSTKQGSFNLIQYTPSIPLGTSKISIKNNGNVGIYNKPNPTYQVHVGGTTHFDEEVSLNTSKYLNSYKNKFSYIEALDTSIGINFISNTKFTNLDAQSAIIGRKRDIKLGYKNKILDFFNTIDEEYSLYVRNGALIIGGDIIPDVPSFHSLGSKRFPWKDIHVNKGTIVFYDNNSEVSSSDATPIAKIGVEGTTALESKIDFKFGGSLDEPISSVQFFNGGPTGQQGQIAVNTNGLHSTLLRAEDQSRGIYGADYVAGSIVQKGSGSFTILLDADDTNANRSKFSIESNAAIPGFATKLLTVSESGETRTYGHLKVDNYITTTNITASNNITANNINTTTLTADRLIVTSITSSIITSSILQTEGSNIFGDSSTDSHTFNGAITASNISASENIISNQIIIGGGTFTSSSLAAAIAGADNLGNHTATQDLNLNNNSILNILHITSSGNISASGIITMLTASIGGGIFTSASLAAGGINDYNLLSNIPNNLVSSSEQIATNISGAFNGITSSFITNQQTSSFVSITELNASSSTLQTNINSKADSSILSNYATDVELISAVGTLITNIDTKASITELNLSSSTLQNNTNTKASIIELNTSSSTLQNNINTKVSSNLTSSFVVNSQTGSFITTNSNATFNNIFAAGSITANNYIISSSVIHLTQSFSSGSTIFGNTSDDTHTFTGNITSSGNISASGVIIGSNLSGINTGDQDLGTYMLSANTASFAITSSNVLFGNITSSGNISASGNLIIGESITINGSTSLINLSGSSLIAATYTNNKRILSLGNTNQDEVKFNGNSFLFNNSITSSGNISASGTIVAFNLLGTNTGDQSLAHLAITSSISGAFANDSSSFSTRVTTLEEATVSLPSNLVSSSTQIALEISGAFNGQTGSFITSIPNGTYSSSLQVLTNITSSGNISASGTITAEHLTSTDDITATGIITGEQLTSTNDGTITNDLLVGDNIFLGDDIQHIGDFNTKFSFADVGKINIVAPSINLTGNTTASSNIIASGTIVASNLSGTNTGDQSLVHLAITSSISGAFAAPSSSFSTRVTSLETNIDGGTF